MLSNIYRFTPPTCTLEIKGKSPLPLWQNKNIPKTFRFRLSFDDPCLPSFDRVTIEGDRRDLERLKTVVDSYIEHYLQTSFQNKNLAEGDSNHDEAGNDRPHLRSQGLTSHQLFFGDLKHDGEQNKIILSTVQLFDLLTALEAYRIQSLLAKQKQNRFPTSMLLWVSLAAGVIIAVGMASLRTQKPVPDIAVSEPESSTPVPQLDRVVPPSIPERSPRVEPKPNQTLSSTERLPPPPAVDTPKPKPNIPDPADYPLSKVARQSGLAEPDKQTESTITIPSQTESEPANSNFARQKNEPTAIDLAQETNLSSEGELARSKDPNLDSADSESETITKAPEKLSQIQQIEAYFSEKWQPPADLKQSLEYRLYLNTDGSIERVIPIGKAGKLYLSQTNIPVRGEGFVSPSTKSQPSVIRLLLNPDGGVKALTE